MVKIRFCLLTLFILSSTASFAQVPKPIDAKNSMFTYRYVIGLESGETMTLDFIYKEDLALIQNLDSIVQDYSDAVFMLKDSLPYETYARRVDYEINNFARKIRIIKYPTLTEEYSTKGTDLMYYKSTQDTVVLTGRVGKQQPGTSQHYYRISFYLNDLHNIEGYYGVLQTKLSVLQREDINQWKRGRNETQFTLAGHPNIYAPGYTMDRDTFLLCFNFSVDLQNFQTLFVPSATIGIVLQHKSMGEQQLYGLSNETHFSFIKQPDGRPKVATNNFLVLSYQRQKVPSNKLTITSNLFPYISFAHLLKARGNIYEPNTNRLMLGKLELMKGDICIGPGFYFCRFLKGVSPTVRMMVEF